MHACLQGAGFCVFANGDNRAMMLIAEIAQCLLQHGYPGFEGLDVSKFTTGISIDSIKQVCQSSTRTPPCSFNSPSHLQVASLPIGCSHCFVCSGRRNTSSIMDTKIW